MEPKGRWVMGVWVTPEDEARLGAEVRKITKAERRAHQQANNIWIG